MRVVNGIGVNMQVQAAVATQETSATQAALAGQINSRDVRGDKLLTDSNQYLTFFMNNEEYGVDILCVQEIRGWESATPIPNAPSQIKGVINLRGIIVPVIDLRQCFGLPQINYTATTVVIVLKISALRGMRTIGIVVDAVSDVYSLTASEMKAPPDLGDSVDTSYIEGLATVNERMVILLKMAQLLESGQMADIEAIKHAQTVQ
jgi:purine-binding chemotaxis protein CheW